MPLRTTAPLIIALSVGVCLLVEIAWYQRAAYLPLLTTQVSDIGSRLGVS